MRIVRRTLLTALCLAIAACGSNPSGNDDDSGPSDPTKTRITVVIPLPLDGEVNSTTHSVYVIAGDNAPLTRDAVTLKGIQCHSISDQIVTCDVDIPKGDPVSIVAEEGRSFYSGQGAVGTLSPPDLWPAEFVSWGGDFKSSEEVESGFLRFTADESRRIEARFQTIYPITLHMNAESIETVYFEVTVQTPTMLTLPPQALFEISKPTPAYGGQSTSAVQWFFLRSGSSLSLEAVDNRDDGCVPGGGVGCSEFLNWTGDCTGNGTCTLTPQARHQGVFAVTTWRV